MSELGLSTLRLNKHADKRLRSGHNWVYSNEVDTQQSPLRDFEPGQQVIVESAQGKAIGIATLNPHTLICARMISRDLRYPLNKSLISHRLKQALSLRQRCFSEPYYRLIYGDSDGLSGLVVDRFDDILVVQISSAGMERVKDDIIAALEQCLRPGAILLKNDGRLRETEGLDCYVADALGEAPELARLRENDTEFYAPIRSGQKTGWFYDHRVSRGQLQAYVRGARVLDVFSYVGAWGIQAAKAGAEQVVCVDSSSSALELVVKNAELNGKGRQLTPIQGSAFDVLQGLIDERERFDVVVVDPPAFIQRRKDLPKGQQAYRRINELALRLMSRDGILVSASCSMHLSRANLGDIVRGAARHVDRQVQIFNQGFQGPDHPVHPSIAETEYLKTLFLRVLPAS